MSDQQPINKRLENIYSVLEGATKSLERVKDMLRNLESDAKKEAYRDMPGVTGIYDGVCLVTEDGKKHDVPANYAAKSRLVFGDTLKEIQEDGKTVFKQIEKVERKKVEGVLTKKEGKWYIISDSGTFKISDTAAEFQHAELNDEAVAFIPASNLNSPYAALDKVNKKIIPGQESGKPASSSVNENKKPASKPRIDRVEKDVSVKAPEAMSSVATVSPSEAKPVETKKAEQPRSSARTDRKPQRTERSNQNRGPRSGGSFRASDAKRPYKPAKSKEYVADIVAAPDEPKTAVNLDDDDLR